MFRKLTTFHYFLLWIFGFFALLAFELFMEAFVFEWLQWNGTNKNDWFFMLWWGLVAAWFIHGLVRLYRSAVSQKHNLGQ